VAPLDELTGR